MPTQSLSKTNSTPLMANFNRSISFYPDPDDLTRVEEFTSNPIERRKEKRRLMKNLFLICLALLLNFISFSGTASLQSSLNSEEGLGTTSLAVIYIALIFSSMFFPSYLISNYGCKWIICFSIVCYAVFPFANLSPRYNTLLPSSLIVGFAAGPLWTAKSTYITTLAKIYSRVSTSTTDEVLNRFFGIFFIIFQFNLPLSQVLSSFILSSKESDNLVLPDCMNKDFVDLYCGRRDCEENFEAVRASFNMSSCPPTQIMLEGVDSTLLWTLMLIYTSIGLLGAVIVGVFVDALTVKLNEKRRHFELVSQTLQHLSDDRRQIMLTVITVYTGLQQAFLTADFTRSFVSCPLGVNWVGFTLVFFGISCSFFSYLFGRIERPTRRYNLLMLAFAVDVSVIITFMIWTPYPTHHIMFFLLPACWGLADAIWQTQINSCYAVFFIEKLEPAFSNHRLWESLGFIMAYSSHKYFCIETKLWIMLTFLVVGMILYTTAEFFDLKKATSTMYTKVPVSQQNRQNINAETTALERE